MTTPLTLERVQAIVAGVAGRSPAAGGPDTPLVDGGFWLDSVHLLEAIIACEIEFGVVFDPAADLGDERLTTVGALFDLILAKRSG